MMQRLICSHDMAVVPREAYILIDSEGPIYFCGLRCLCLWALTVSTKPNLRREQLDVPVVLKTADGEEHAFRGLRPLARWACERALGEEQALI
jgi:hypothetical protein